MFWQPNKLTNLKNTLRGKLTLWYLGSIGLIIAIFLIAIAILFRLTITNQIDHHIHIAVNEAAQIVQNFTGPQRDQLLKNLVSAQGMTIVVLSPDGSPIIETNSPDVALVTEHQLQKILTSQNLYQSTPVHFTESNIRFAAMPVQISAGKGILAVGYSTRVITASMLNMFWIVAFLIILIVIPITFIGYRLLKKQLSPLENIAVQAQAITDTNLSKRIRLSSATQELATIQSALNTMLSRLESFFQSEQTFFADAAHTLKTPLAILKSQLETSTLSKNLKSQLLDQIDSTSETIQDLLFLSKLTNSNQDTTTFSLTKLLTNLTELATTLGEEKHLTVTSNIKQGVLITANQKLLRRALGNLVHNAVSYNKPNGTIHIGLQTKAGKKIITIKDTGLGIKKSDQSQVFSRFYRGSDTQTPGSGLGLAIAKQIIESTGGTISLKSRQGSGTTLTITLP